MFLTAPPASVQADYNPRPWHPLTTPLEARRDSIRGNYADCPNRRDHGARMDHGVGPGVIALGVSIGSGEFLLGPAAFVQHGLSLLWVVIVAVTFQTIFNTEVMRYTLATGEPVFTGFMRTRPSSTLWAWVYAMLYFLQVGWPAWAGTAAAAIFFLFARRLAGAATPRRSTGSAWRRFWLRRHSDRRAAASSARSSCSTGCSSSRSSVASCC